jgi:hypothetical protein
MKNKITYFWIFVLIIFSCKNRNTQESTNVEKEEEKTEMDTVGVFDEYDFNIGGYKFYATFWADEDWGSDLADSVGMFYINDISKLNELKSSWKLPVDNAFYSCGYDYNFYLTYNDSVVSTMSLNIKCHSLVDKNRSYYFRRDNFNVFSSGIKKLEEIKHEKITKSEVFEIIDKCKTDENFFTPISKDDPSLNFMGYFTFNHQRTSNDEYDVITENYRNIIKKTSRDPFSIDTIFSDSRLYHYIVNCSKKVYDNFDVSNKERYVKYNPLKTIRVYKLIPTTLCKPAICP